MVRSTVRLVKISEARKLLQTPDTVVGVLEYEDLLPAWKEDGGPETQCRFHVSRLLTQSQVDRLPKSLRLRLKCRTKREAGATRVAGH
jgi:hypothetical protein